MAPIDSPPTMIVSQTASSFKSAASTLAYHCCQVVASRSSSVPQWPASWQQCTVKPPDAMPLAAMRNSSGVPPRPCARRKPVRLPGMVKLRSLVVMVSCRSLSRWALKRLDVPRRCCRPRHAEPATIATPKVMSQAPSHCGRPTRSPRTVALARVTPRKFKLAIG